MIGVGAIPALVAILFRLAIPESPRYTLDVDNDTVRALQDTRDHYGSQDTIDTHELSHQDSSRYRDDDAEAGGAHSPVPTPPGTPPGTRPSSPLAHERREDAQEGRQEAFLAGFLRAPFEER